MLISGVTDVESLAETVSEDVFLRTLSGCVLDKLPDLLQNHHEECALYA